MTRETISVGTRAGGVLALLTILLAVLGLTPELSWIPEVPLLIGAALAPAAVLGLAGYRAALASGSVLPGLVAGGIAGAIGGGVGGLAYVGFGKPALNIIVGLVFGAVGGAVLGALGAIVAGRRAQ